ncbi:MAG TPA: diguanylate cyclase [Candidatus Saccharimonadales bacterium]|nr:diguanylate cyclase [Candidatus Saccharimonadales bacterium]
MPDSGLPQLHRILLEALPQAICVVNRDGKVLLWSAGAEQMTGYFRQEILGRPFPNNFHQEDHEGSPDTPKHFSPLLETLREGHPVSTHLSLRTKSGQLLPVRLRTVPLRDDNGAMIGAAEICETVYKSEIAERRQARLGAFGCLDPITGVLNHSLIQARLKESLNIYALYPIPFCVLCVSVDNLKNVRQRYGQAAADSTLRLIAQTIQSALRPIDFIGRWLDQEFLVILNECVEFDVHTVGDRLCKSARQTEISWWGDVLHVTISVGATVVHDHDAASSVISRAESALRESSEAGGNRVVVSTS